MHNEIIFSFNLKYLAPEVLKKKPYDRTVDWWCLGGVLYEMLFGLVCSSSFYSPSFYQIAFVIFFFQQPPFYSTNVDEMYRNILEKPLRFPNNASNDSINILTGVSKNVSTTRHLLDFKLCIRHEKFYLFF